VTSGIVMEVEAMLDVDGASVCHGQTSVLLRKTVNDEEEAAE